MAQQVRTFEDMSVREMVDGVGKDVITWNNDGEVLIGKLHYIRADKNDYNLAAGITVKIGKDLIHWNDELWKNAVFA